MGNISNLFQNSNKNSFTPDLWSEIMLFDSIKSVVTSKKALLLVDNQTYCFMVNPKLTKPLIKRGIEKYFNVRVLKINVLNSPRRQKRMGKYSGFCSSYKKVIVTLNYDDQINLFSDI
jgi:large subunit ribosomal protein L23